MNKVLTKQIILIALALLIGGTVSAQRSTTGVHVGGNVYGGGNKADVKGNATVDIDQAMAVVDHDVYGGGALAHVNVTTENNVSSHTPNTTTNVTLTKGKVGGNVYGGGLGQRNGVNNATSDIEALVYGPVKVTIEGGIVSGSVFGCNNFNGAPQSTTEVEVKGGTVEQSVYGGGNLADYTGDPLVNIIGGTVEQDVYGGGLGASAVVTGDPEVNINGGSVGNDVFGGGSEAAVVGATHVTVTTGSVGQDVYGGGALANTGATTVDIMGGTIAQNIYGGGLGNGTHAPEESGVITVNIGDGTPSETETGENFTGSATIGGSVYGCNNSAGSPLDFVTVNVYRTDHTDGPTGNSVDGTGYAIANVFGGGNAANYTPSDKKATVNIFGCYNTIGRVFGGGDAAATPSVETLIQGGRIGEVFGGGNGESGPPGANVNGTVNLTIHGGTVGEFYGGSNQNGTISGQITTIVDSNGPCGSLTITEFFCGGNFVDITNGLTTTIECSDNLNVNYLYGGCNQANISGGDVVLNVCGGTYDYVFAGSKGRLAYPNQYHPEYTDPTHPDAKSADITGNVILNLYGGTIGNVFGGSNVLGNILGTITVNVLDKESVTCPLIITNIYGGSNLTNYEPTNSSLVSPIVNVVHAKYDILGNVYGGSKGETVTSTTVKANPKVHIGYEFGMTGLPETSVYNPASYSRKTTIHGSVYGGGDAAKVEGNTEIHINKHAKVLTNVYGGGNMGEVEGNTKVIINGKWE